MGAVVLFLTMFAAPEGFAPLTHHPVQGLSRQVAYRLTTRRLVFPLIWRTFQGSNPSLGYPPHPTRAIRGRTIRTFWRDGPLSDSLDDPFT